MPKDTGVVVLPAASGGQVVLVAVDPASWPRVAKEMAAAKVLDAASAVFTLYPSRRMESDRHEHSVLCVAGQAELQRVVDVSLDIAARAVTLRDPDIEQATKQTYLSYLTGRVDPFAVAGQLVGYGATLAAVAGAPSHGALVPIAASLAKKANCPLVLSAADLASEDEAIERLAAVLRTKSDRFSLRREWSDALKGRGLQQSALGLFLRAPVDQHVPKLPDGDEAQADAAVAVVAPELPPPPTPLPGAKEASADSPAATPPAAASLDAASTAAAAHAREFPMNAAMQVLLAPVKGAGDPRKALSKWVLERAGLDARQTAAAAAGYDALPYPRKLDVAAAAVVDRSDEVLRAISEASERPNEEFALQNFSGEQPRWLPDVPRMARALLGGPGMIVPELQGQRWPSLAALFPSLCPRSGLPLAVQLHSLAPHGQSVVAVVPPGLAKGIVVAWPAAGQIVGTSRLVAAASAAAASGVAAGAEEQAEGAEEEIEAEGQEEGSLPVASSDVVPPSLPAWLEQPRRDLNDSLGIEGRHRRKRASKTPAPAVLVCSEDVALAGVVPMWEGAGPAGVPGSQEALPVEVLLAAAGGGEARARISSHDHRASGGAHPLCHSVAAVVGVLQSELQASRPTKHAPRFGFFDDDSAGQDDPDHLFPSPGMLALLVATLGRPEAMRVPSPSPSHLRALVSMVDSDDNLAIARAKSDGWALWNVDAESGEEVLATVEVGEEVAAAAGIDTAPAAAAEAARQRRRDAAASEGPRARHGVPLDASTFVEPAQTLHQKLERRLEREAENGGFSLFGAVISSALAGSAVLSFRYVRQHSREVARRAKLPARRRWQLGPTSVKPLMAASLAAAGVFATFATIQSVLEIPWSASSVRGAAEGLQLLQQWRRHEVGGPLSKWFRERWLQPGLDQLGRSGGEVDGPAQGGAPR